MSMSTTDDDWDISHELITREFLESQLGILIEKLTVESGAKPGDNYNSVLYSISVETRPSRNDETTLSDGKTEYFLLKCYPSHPSRQQSLNRSNVFYNELSFYQTLAKDLVQFQTKIAGLPKQDVIFPAFPPVHGGNAVNFSDHSDDTSMQNKVYSPLDNFILMTDMRKTLNFKMTDRKIGLDVDHVKLVFNELATFHALSWAYRKKVEWNLIDKYPFLIRPGNPKKTEMWMGILKETAGTAIAAIDSIRGKGNELSKAVQNFCEGGRTTFEYFSTAEEALELELQKLIRKQAHVEDTEHINHWRVACHGDCWSNNMLFQYDKDSGKPQHVVLVDFPLVKLACPTLDLGCLVYTSTRRDFREKHLQECLQAYHHTFVQVCERMKVECLPGFTFDEIKNRFQASKLVGFLIALVSLPQNLIAEENEQDLEDKSMEEVIQEASGGGSEVKGTSLYKEWILELVEDLYNDGVIC